MISKKYKKYDLQLKVEWHYTRIVSINKLGIHDDKDKETFIAEQIRHTYYRRQLRKEIIRLMFGA